MSDLTKQYFDKQLGRLATKEDIKRIDNKIEGLVTKKNLNEEITDLAGMFSRRFDELEKKLDLRSEVDQLKTQMKKVWEALNIAHK